MPDFRVADTAPEHPKLRAAGLAAAGLWAAGGAYAMRELTDGWVPDYWIRSWPGGAAAARKLVAVGLWAAENRQGLPGYRFHDWTDYQRTAEQLAAERSAQGTRRSLHGDTELLAAIKQRDLDRCRYCARHVNWLDRRSAGGGTYDHVVPIPAGGRNVLDNVVVACRGCNAGKRSRTPAEAGMVLLPPPGPGPVPDPPGTTARSVPGSVPGSVPDPIPTRNGSSSVPRNPHPGPIPSSSSVRGERSGTEREPSRDGPPPRPRCALHADIPPGTPVPPCGACADLRRTAQLAATEAAITADADRIRRRVAINDCRHCDDNGLRETDRGLTRCAHPALEAVS
jgi:hypothetical protein